MGNKGQLRIILPAVLCLVVALQELPSVAHGGAPPAREACRDVAPLDRYFAGSLAVRLSLWAGLKLYRADQKLELGYFGAGYERIFAGSADALEEMGTFRVMRLSGMALYAIGLGALVVDLVLLLTNKTLLIESGAVKPLFWGLLIPGTVVGMIGGFLIQGANGRLSSAVRAYNRDLYRRLRGGQTAAAARAIRVSWTGRF